jgi:tripartite motif-containing protein 2/3
MFLCLQVFNLSSGSLYSTIDSHGCKLKRPTGLAVMSDRHLVVADIGNDCIKKFRYF